MSVSEIHLSYKDEYTGVVLDCIVHCSEYEPPVTASGGLVIEPAIDEEAVLYEALHKGEDIMYLLSEAVIDSIERAAARKAQEAYL